MRHLVAEAAAGLMLLDALAPSDDALAQLFDLAARMNATVGELARRMTALEFLLWCRRDEQIAAQRRQAATVARLQRLNAASGLGAR